MGRRIFNGVLSVCFAFLACICFACSPKLKYYEYEDTVFCGAMPLSVKIAGKNAKKAYEEMLSVLEEINLEVNINSTVTFSNLSAKLTAQNFESDILKFNRAAAGREIKLGKHSYYLIKKAQEIYNDSATQYAFNAAIYPLTYLWGVDALNLSPYGFSRAPPPSFKDGYTVPIEATQKPSGIQIEQIKTLCDMNNLKITERNGEFFASKTADGLMLDLGGIAKGYALDLCREICEKYSIDSAVINLSGHLLMFKKQNKTDDWLIPVREPKPMGFFEEYVCAFYCDGDTTAVTSGDYQRMRRMFTDDFKTQITDEVTDVCHILDPRTGTPYNICLDVDGNYKNLSDNVVSCTIILQDGALADAYATIACVIGIEKAVEFLNDKGIKGILLTKDKRMALTGGMTLVDDDDALMGYKEYKIYA